MKKLLSNFVKKTPAQSYDQDLKKIGEDITHELRTPLSTIKGGISGVKDCLDRLIKAYTVASNHNLEIPDIFPQELSSLEDALDNCEREAYYASNYVNMLSAHLVDETILPGELENLSIRECIKDSFYLYPYRTITQKKMLQIDLQFFDFTFRGKKASILQVFSNLIRNSIRNIGQEQSGGIDVTTKLENNYNCVIFKDSGSNMENQDLVRIFERFYSGLNQGIGLGLHFCKRVMQAIGGDIICQKLDNGKIQFLLTFPLVNQGDL